MKHILKRLFLVSAVVVGVLGTATVARAAMPTLSLYSTGNGDSVQVSVTGDINSGITLYYGASGYAYGQQTRFLGTTNSSGYFSTTVSASSYGISAGSSVYVVVNGQQSQTMTWPYFSGNTTYGSITFSQSSVTLGSGQSTNITIYGGYAPYTMSFSTTNVFQAVQAGNTLTVSGLNAGSGTIQICSSGNYSCGTVHVTVSGYTGGCYNNCYNVTPISFSQNNPAVSYGQSINVSIYGGGTYYIGHNSNSTAVGATINGSTLTLSANNVQYFAPIGSTAIVVCSTSTNCGALTVTMGSGSNSGNTGAFTYCANEHGFCYFSGTKQVRYGTNGVYYYRTFTNGISCSNAVFGDPVPNVVKQCSISDSYVY